MPHVATTLLYRWFNEVWNQGDPNAIDALLTDDAVVHGIDTGQGLRGPAGFHHFYQSFTGQFDNIHIDVLEAVSEEDMEAARCRVRATTRDTATPVSFEGMCMVRVENGKIAEAWNNFDFLRMNEQLGMRMVPEGANA